MYSFHWLHYMRLYMRICPSVRPSVHPFVCLSVSMYVKPPKTHDFSQENQCGHTLTYFRRILLPARLCFILTQPASIILVMVSVSPIPCFFSLNYQTCLWCYFIANHKTVYLLSNGSFCFAIGKNVVFFCGAILGVQ